MKTILLGAGASIPFFNPILSTDYLTSAVVNERNWRQAVEHLNHECCYEKITEQLLNEVVAIAALLRETYNYNFEQIAVGRDGSTDHFLGEVPSILSL